MRAMAKPHAPRMSSSSPRPVVVINGWRVDAGGLPVASPDGLLCSTFGLEVGRGVLSTPIGVPVWGMVVVGGVDDGLAAVPPLVLAPGWEIFASWLLVVLIPGNGRVEKALESKNTRPRTAAATLSQCSTCIGRRGLALLMWGWDVGRRADTGDR